MFEYRQTHWCSTPGCACTAKYEHGGYYGWYYRCRIHARGMLGGFIWPIGTLGKSAP